MKATRHIVIWLLKKLAKITIWRYHPEVIGITGTVGKTSTKYAVSAVMRSEKTVRVAAGNFNEEVGLSLTILGDWSERERELFSRVYDFGKNRGKKLLFLIKIVLVSIFKIVFRVQYPEILVLEYGVDRHGDMKRLLDIVRPRVAVVTAVGEVPVHVEFFSGPEDVAREKGKIIEQLPVAGCAILNADDDAVVGLREKTRGQVSTFGFSRSATVQITSYEYRLENNRPLGISFKLEHGGGFVPVRIDGAFGKGQGYAACAAAAVGMVFGINLVKISESLSGYKSPPHRMELVPGVKYTFVIDDTYNASPLSMDEALHVLNELPGKRKVAVLGDMLEIGKYALEAHERVGQVVAKFVDTLITVGPRAKFIAEAAQDAGMQKKHIHEFDSSKAAAKTVERIMRRGDLVLVKGSHAMQMEKIVEEIKAF